MNRIRAGFLNWIFVVIMVSTVIIFFVAGKDSKESAESTLSAPVINQNAYYHLSDLMAEAKSSELDQRFARLNKKGVFNGTILYAEYGKVVYKGAFGFADFRKRDSMQVDDSFQLASVSKMFTATAIILLKEKGELDFDDSLGKFIPEFPYGSVTIRQLLNHRSGLSRYMSLADKYWDINKPINNEDVIDLFVKYNPAPYFKPGKGFHYCNTNYALLASVVERITSDPFDQFVQDHIFKPLGMDHSFIYKLAHDRSIQYEVPVGVPGYRYSRRGWRKVGDYYLNGVIGDKGVYSSVEDLFRFSLALDNATLINREDIEAAFSPGSPSYYKRKDNYGFGWRIKTGKDSTVYHFGWWKGFRTFFIRDMKNQRTLISLTNTHRGLSSGVFWDIINDTGRSEEIMKTYSQLNQ